jgi:CDP-4-dehydro-6-deoxyglucose reductase
MAHFLSLSRAAHLVSASRVALQQKIRSGELASFDGMVSADDLLRLYPDIKLEEEGGFERVTQIKEQAFGKRVRERLLPSQEVLAQRLFEQSRELADVRAHLQRYHAVVVRLRSRIAEAGAVAPAEARALFAALGDSLEAELAAVLAQEAPNALAVMDDMLRVMSAHVVLHPSGHEFFVDGADTLLDAALRSGLAVNYGCSDGRCGLCKARVVSGQVKKVRPHDYVLSEAEKSQGYALLCCNTAAGDLVLEALESSATGDIPEQQVVAQVKALTKLDGELALLHLQTPRNNRLRFLAGQQVTLASGEASAQLPVASCPCDERNLHFHVAPDPDDAFAARVFSGLKAGDAVTVFGPWGDFVLRTESPRPLLFVACDTGFAPIKGLLEHAQALDSVERMHLYWLATRASGHYLANLCRSWADALDNFRYSLLSAQDAAAGAEAVVRQLTGDHGDFAGFDLYLAGPPAFVEAAVKALHAQGFPREQIFAASL